MQYLPSCLVDLSSLNRRGLRGAQRCAETLLAAAPPCHTPIPGHDPARESSRLWNSSSFMPNDAVTQTLRAIINDREWRCCMCGRLFSEEHAGYVKISSRRALKARCDRAFSVNPLRRERPRMIANAQSHTEIQTTTSRQPHAIPYRVPSLTVVQDRRSGATVLDS